MDVVAHIQAVLGLLEAYTDLPGVAALIATGTAILRNILVVIELHPWVFAGIVTIALLVIYLPEVINWLANWVIRLRQSMHRLRTNWHAQIHALELATELQNPVHLVV